MLKKFFSLVLALAVIGLIFNDKLNLVKADELSEIERKLSELKDAYDLSVAATKPLESEVSRLQKQLNLIQNSIKQADENLQELEQSIFEREVDLEYQYALLESRVRSWYIHRQQYNPMLIFLSQSNHATQVTREITYRQAATEQDKQMILNVSKQLVKLEQDKKQVEVDKERLEAVKISADQQARFLQGEINKAKEYQSDLTSEIAELTAKQQQLLAEKTGTFTTSVGDVPLADDPASRPDYDPGFRPAFAAFSFGAPHYKGMSQYGARGRARSGQNEEQIIRAYYGDVRIEQKGNLPSSINTSIGSLPLEENYLMGIAEMPSNWDDNNLAALKAQAIAARTYAVSYVGWRVNGGGGNGSICTSENCQVYRSDKAASPPENWRRAVQDTRGKIVVSNQTNELISTWYAASSGGYQESYTSLGHSTPGIWDTSCGSQGCWTGDAYEKIGESPWFYKGWYKSRSGKSCSRSHPWLSESEFADIVNALIVHKHNQGALGHLSQVDGCLGSVPDTWSVDQVRQEATKFGGPVDSISDVSVTYASSGVTANVHVGTNKGGFDFTGSNFKLIFNLRAPGVVHLKSGLFNIEKK